MALAVITVASGGLPVVDVTASTPRLGLPVTEALGGRGIAVTKVAAYGVPVTYSTVAASTAIPNMNIYELGDNASGVARGNAYRLAMITIGAGLGAAAALRIKNRFRTRLTAVGVP